MSHDAAANLGITETFLKKWDEAAEHLDLALRTFPTAGPAENRARLEKLLAESKSHVATLNEVYTRAQ